MENFYVYLIRHPGMSRPYYYDYKHEISTWTQPEGSIIVPAPNTKIYPLPTDTPPIRFRDISKSPPKTRGVVTEETPGKQKSILEYINLSVWDEFCAPFDINFDFQNFINGTLQTFFLEHPIAGGDIQMSSLQKHKIRFLNAVEVYFDRGGYENLTTVYELLNSSQDIPTFALELLMHEIVLSLSSTNQLRRFRLFLFIVSVANYSKEMREIVRLFAIVVSCNKTLSQQTRDLAMMAVFRLSSEFVFQVESVSGSFETLTSTSSLFRFSLHEILWKEKKAGLKQNGYVPAIFDYLLDLFDKMGGFETEGVFRVNGSKLRQSTLMQDINRGCWRPDPESHSMNISIESVVMVTDIMKSFIRELNPELINSELLGEAQPESSFEELCLIFEKMQEPNRAVFSRIILFFQKLVQHEKQTKMNLKNLLICFGTSLTRLKKPETLEDLTADKSTPILFNFITKFVENLTFDDVKYLVTSESPKKLGKATSCLRVSPPKPFGETS